MKRLYTPWLAGAAALMLLLAVALFFAPPAAQTAPAPVAAKEENKMPERTPIPMPSYAPMDQAQLKQQLSGLQYRVTQQADTERPYQNEYYDQFAPGIYVDITSGQPLFVSTDKFESGCGWPAFSRPIDPSLIAENRDISHGMVRTEVKSALSGAHLGHVFTDGPSQSGGLRYCINSASLRFIPQAQMESQGYGYLLPLLENKPVP